MLSPTKDCDIHDESVKHPGAQPPVADPAESHTRQGVTDFGAFRL